MPSLSSFIARETAVERLEISHLDCIEQVRQAAPAWDRLWDRSEVGSPLFRAEMVAQWLEQFAPESRFRGLLVSRGGRLMAALPLVGRRVRGVLPAGDLTINGWSPNGELLLDPGDDQAEVLDLLVQGVRDAGWPLVWLQTVPLESPRWDMFLAALRRGPFAGQVSWRYAIGQVDLEGGWSRCTAGWSKNHQRNLRKDLRRLGAQGPLEFSFHRQFAPSQVDEMVARAFELEDRSWKGTAGCSVVRTPGMLDFFLRQARQLAAWGCLRLAFLHFRGRPIAFEYGWEGKGVYYSYKVGYEPAYASYGPGHLLRYHLVRELCGDPQVRRIDFHGPMTEALAAWATDSYRIGRLIVAPRRIPGRLLLAGLSALRRIAGKRSDPSDSDSYSAARTTKTQASANST